MMKVFIDHSEISFPEKLEEAGENLLIEPNEEKIKELIKGCFNKSNVNIALFSQNRNELISLFEKNFRFVQAAGGIVQAKNTKRLLFIKHRNCWCLPKGWREKEESAQQNAIREVEEETQTKNLKVEQFLIKTWHAYKENEQTILKETDWFSMLCDDESYKLQSEEDITDCRFVTTQELDEILEESHKNIRLVIDCWLEKKK